MRLLIASALPLSLLLTPALAQPFYGEGACPAKLRPNGSFCVMNIPNSIRNPGICPPEYVSTADGTYCVLAPRNQWVLTRANCPNGTKPSKGGEYCAGAQAAESPAATP
ncbi:hypothetical protein [Microvirga arsenatis]|uniref:DUF3551 domain-containing protein n=1 Tax=Microvirga arsenatis TaxID=2692265 RepID=A0ABW9YVX6_9HYPH|nr:hypothetical protein [Microvirga arsenatis]NBJ10538.1 hypothetical protein [Microvirga arsenatis]NBJ24563.1 hypothetical protein [Microvirga arsenatis]